MRVQDTAEVPAPPPPPPHPHPLTQRTIVCEGWVSVSAPGNLGHLENPATTSDNDSAAAARARPSVKRKPSLRRRSLDALRGAVLGVFRGDKDTKAPPSAGVGEERCRNLKAWLDDAAVLYLDGWAAGAADGDAAEADERLRADGGGLGEGTGLMVPASVMDLRDAYSGIRAKKKKKSKALDIWDRRVWDAGAGLSSEISLPSTASQTSLFCVSAAAPPRAPLLTPFRVLASSLDLAASAILLTVDALPTVNTATSPSLPSQPSPLSQPRLQPPPEHEQHKHHHHHQHQHHRPQQLRMHFTSTRKLARWSAALSLALCVSHATRHAKLQARGQQRRRSDGLNQRCDDRFAGDDAREKEAEEEEEEEEDIVRRCEEVERAAHAAQKETRRAVRRVRRERRERAQRVAAMLSVEEVQDVYQQTANALATAQNRITHLTQLIAQERVEKERATTSLANLRAQRDPLRAAAVHSALQMRHEDLCRRYKELRKEAAMGKAMWERERERHVTLAEWVRAVAVDGVDGEDGHRALEDERQAGMVLALNTAAGGVRAYAPSISLPSALPLSILPTEPATPPDAGGTRRYNEKSVVEEESSSCKPDNRSIVKPLPMTAHTAPSGRAITTALLSPPPSPPAPAAEEVNAQTTPTVTLLSSGVIWCNYNETPSLSSSHSSTHPSMDR
ncbi:hypothetical protein HDU89_005613 [Geranomyces variabilis]|nr:hypothetical protein HDU89_005613 [Geranomyces variabilis]